MEALYFRISEPPDPATFDPGWIEIPPGRFVLDRTVWRGDAVSRTSERCVVLRVDHEDRTWEIKNRAVGRSLVLHDGSRRRELQTGMAMELHDGRWSAWISDAFRFTMRTAPLPDGVQVRRVGERSTQLPLNEDETRREPPEVTRARAFLHSPRDDAWKRRIALAHLWREYLLPTRAVAQELPSDLVARDLGVTIKRISAWRGDLSAQAYHRRDWADRTRDLVVHHGVLTREDVVSADAEIDRRRRR